MKSRLIQCVLLIVTLLAASACTTIGGGSSTPVSDRILSRGEIRVGMTGDYPPLNAVNRAGRHIGLEPDLAQALASTLGVKLVIVNKPFAELLPALEAGEVDAVMSGMTMTPKRNLKVAFAGPYFISGKGLLTKSMTLAQVQDLETLGGSKVTLAVLEGSTSESLAKSALKNADLRPAPNYDAAVKMVLSGEVQALFADYPITVLAVLRNPASGLVTVVAPLSYEPIGIALPADDPLLLNAVQNYLDSLEQTGLLTQLRASWFENSAWLGELP